MADPFVRQFRSAAQRYLEESHRLFPQDASDLGLREYDAMLGSNSAATHLEHARLVAETLAQVESIPDDAFTGDDWLDRRGFLSMLRAAALHDERERWRVDPQAHCDAAVNAIFNLLIRNSEKLKQKLHAIESRLAELPRFLAEGAACVRKPVPLWTKLAIRSAEAAQEFMRGLEAELVPISPNAERTQSLLRAAVAAFGAYAAAIEKKPSGPVNGYSLGSSAFEMLVRERTGLPYSVREIAALSDRLVAKLNEELRVESRRLGGKTARDVLDAATARWSPKESSLLEEYRRVNTEVRAAFETANLVTFPQGERCRVLPTPPFMRHHFPTAAYSAPGPFAKDQTGIFWVNDLSLEQTDPAKKAAEVRQHFGMEFTCAHEAYPGHHLQFCIQNRHPSKLRRLFAHAIFYEGWTLWCEKMSVDQGVIKLPEARLIQLHDALWRAHRIGIDCGLHSGSLSFAGACKKLQDGVGFTAARARGDVNWYTSSPTVPMSYLLGRLEVERLHAYLVGREGWSLKQFNDWALSHGAIPWRWIWEARLRGAAVPKADAA